MAKKKVAKKGAVPRDPDVVKMEEFLNALEIEGNPMDALGLKPNYSYNSGALLVSQLLHPDGTVKDPGFRSPQVSPDFEHVLRTVNRFVLPCLDVSMHDPFRSDGAKKLFYDAVRLYMLGYINIDAPVSLSDSAREELKIRYIREELYAFCSYNLQIRFPKAAHCSVMLSLLPVYIADWRELEALEKFQRS